MLNDPYQVEGTAGTAISTGEAKVNFEAQTNPAVILKWTAGTGTLSVGDTIDNSINGAQSTLVQILEGDSTAGTGLFNASNATAWSDSAQTLDDSPSAGDWSATYTVGSLVEFDYLIDCNDNATTGITIQQLYDYMNAKADEATIDTTPYDHREVMYWANGEANPLPLVGTATGSPNKFKTIRNVADTAGVALYNFTGGNSSIDFFTGNDGSTWTPSATVTLFVKVVEGDFVTNNPGARVGIHRQSDNSEIFNGITDAQGEVSTSFNYTSDVPVFIRVRDESFNYVKVPGTITSSGLNTTISTGDDDIYAAT
ncbi:MAG: hypothetical protein JSU72_20920 [Deltaproteobacteria bacterium]|nr:MAG: hypothetical protein JSU72_20920 [Deltaproteobacteria bacterium]